MAARNKEAKRLEAAIKPYGLTIVHGRKHKHIQNTEGKNVYHMSSSPSCQYFAVNTLHDLIKHGLVPKGVKLWTKTSQTSNLFTTVKVF